jgi:hypothetical protein
MKTSFHFLLVIVILFFSSCDLFRDITNPDPDPATGCVLVETNLTIPNDPAHELTEYKYNASGSLIEVIKKAWDMDPDPYIDRTTISYNGVKVNQIKTYFTFLSDPEEAHAVYTFFFEGDLVDSVRITSGEPYNQNGYMLTEYTGDKLSKLIGYNFNTVTSAYYENGTTSIDWTGDNITKTTTTNINSPQNSIIEYEYDDKKTPLNNLGLAVSSNVLTMLSSNNVISRKNLAADGTVFSTTETSYTYNDTNYPITSTWGGGYPTNYVYDCN